MTTAPLPSGQRTSSCSASSVFAIQTQRGRVQRGSTGMRGASGPRLRNPIEAGSFLTSEHLT